jgi:nucleotide-binding universal stress UspA family protein
LLGVPVSSYSTILVGTDGSKSSFRAVEKAAALAADAGAKLVIVSAYHEMSERDRKRAAEQLGDNAYKVVGSHPAEDILVEAKGIAAGAGAQDVTTIAKAGDPVDVLADQVVASKADLCVVGNRGLNSLAGRLIGSVPANISHRSASDVLIVHTTTGKAT